MTKYVQSLDPSRIYNCASGWIDVPVGDLIDMHKYVGPGAFNPTPTRASVLGEFGGLGLKIDNHQWIPEDSFSYEMQVQQLSPHALESLGQMLSLQPISLAQQRHCSKSIVFGSESGLKVDNSPKPRWIPNTC